MRAVHAHPHHRRAPRISRRVDGDWIVTTIEPASVDEPTLEVLCNRWALERGKRLVAAAGAQIGPHLQQWINRLKLPAWLAERFHDEGDALQRAAFAATMYAYRGYGKTKNRGLPTDKRALATLLNPSARFWQTSPERKRDRDWGVKHAPKLTTSTHWTLGPLDDIARAVSKIPILGPVLKAAAAPLTTAVHLAEGERLDHALLGAMKDQLSAIKAVAPYATTIVSFVPGIGTGIAAAIAAGAALAEGKSITTALEAAVRDSLPGGELAQTAFDMARKIASGENVGKAALETARSQLPPIAQKAFDIGLAVTSGKNMQAAIARAVTSLAPAELSQILDAGTKALQSTPGLATIVNALPSDIARKGAQLASGVLAHQGANEAQIRAMRAKLAGDALHGFDVALKTQEAHFPWIRSIMEQKAAEQVATSVARSSSAALHAAQLAALRAVHAPSSSAALHAAQLAALRAVHAPSPPRAPAHLARVVSKPIRPIRPHVLEPGHPIGSDARAAQNAPGWHGVTAGTTTPGEQAFVAANRLLEDDEQRRRPIGPHLAQLRELQRSPAHREAATRALTVLAIVRQWRAGLHAAQRAGCGGESSILGGVGNATIVGGVELPPSPIPVERLIAAGVRPGTF